MMLKLKNFFRSVEGRIISGFALLKLILHLITATNYELQRDAYLYLAMGDHLDFGFITVPPFMGFLSWLHNYILGDSVMMVRFFPALVGAVSLILVGQMVLELKGKIWAILITCVAFLVSPVFLRVCCLYQPVVFNMFFWVLTTWLVIRMVQRGNPKYWLYLGTLWGFAFLNKYSIVFLALAFFLALLLSPQRKLLLSRYLLYGILIGLGIILPNLIWQHTHNWPVLGHMIELQQTQLVNVRIQDFLSMQMMIHGSSTLIWLCGLGSILFYKKFEQIRLLGYTYIILLLILLLLSGKFYYTMGIYPALFAVGGVAIERWFRQRFIFVKPVLIGLMLLLAVPALPLSLPLLPMDAMVAYAREARKYGAEGIMRWEDGRIHSLPQDYADMTGWQELGDIVISTYQDLDAEQRRGCRIFAENYGTAGAIRYYGKDAGLPEPVCFSGSFLLWAPDSGQIDYLIYVNTDISEMTRYFASVELRGHITNPHARESGMAVWLCSQPRQRFIKFYQNKVKWLKSRYQ